MDYNGVEHRGGRSSHPIWLERAPLLHTWDRAEAWLVQELISSYGIPCLVVSADPHFLFPGAIANGFQVMVALERVREAHRLLADHLRQGLKLLQGGRRREASGAEATNTAASRLRWRERPGDALE